jgi:hypothetical protein
LDEIAYFSYFNSSNKEENCRTSCYLPKKYDYDSSRFKNFKSPGEKLFLILQAVNVLMKCFDGKKKRFLRDQRTTLRREVASKLKYDKTDRWNEVGTSND